MEPVSAQMATLWTADGLPDVPARPPTAASSSEKSLGAYPTAPSPVSLFTQPRASWPDQPLYNAQQSWKQQYSAWPFISSLGSSSCTKPRARVCCMRAAIWMDNSFISPLLHCDLLLLRLISCPRQPDIYSGYSRLDPAAAPVMHITSIHSTSTKMYRKFRTDLEEK